MTSSLTVPWIIISAAPYLLALLATVVALLLLRLLRSGMRRLTETIRAQVALKETPPQVEGAELMTRPNLLAGRKVLRSLVLLVRAIHVLLAALALGAWVYAVLSLFPHTRPLVDTLLSYALQPAQMAWQGVIAYVPKLFFIAVVMAITWAVIKLTRYAFAEIGKEVIQLPGFLTEWAEPTYRIVRFFILAFAAVMIYPYLPGAETKAFEGLSIFFGVLFSLSSSAAVSNVIAGTILTYTHAFRIGDRVRIADTEGDVIGRALLATRIRTIKNVDVTVPNAKVLADHIVNYSAAAEEHGLILHDDVTIGYDVPWRKVHELLIAAARNTEYVLGDPPPYVLQSGLDDFYACYTINAYTREPNAMAAIYSELRQNIQDAFHGAGVEIASAHYVALRDGSHPNMPAENATGTMPVRVAVVNDVTNNQAACSQGD